MASEDKFAGGKGINVQSCFEASRYREHATGFIGGFTGRFIEDVLTSEDISTNFVTVDQDTMDQCQDPRLMRKLESMGMVQK